MSRRHDLERHRHSLAEIRDIMNSMSTLAYMETRKLARFLDAQQAVVRSIEETAADALRFYPELLPQDLIASSVYILVGSERGFCGDFNHAVISTANRIAATQPEDQPWLIAIGRKLHLLLEKDPRLVANIDGASVAEEVDRVLNDLTDALSELQAKQPSMRLYCIYHDQQHELTSKLLLPPFQHSQSFKTSANGYPPRLNLSPRDFFQKLTEHYLFAALHEMLYTSLAAENAKRVAHLQEAVHHLDEESEDLDKRCQVLRQEEIIEEIELMLLSTGATARLG